MIRMNAPFPCSWYLVKMGVPVLPALPTLHRHEGGRGELTGHCHHVLKGMVGLSALAWRATNVDDKLQASDDSKLFIDHYCYGHSALNTQKHS